MAERRSLAHNIRLRERTIRAHRLSVLTGSPARVGVLLVHGNSSSSSAFYAQFGTLTRMGLGLVAPDLPGHGRSAWSNTPRSTYSFPGYARILHELMGELGFKTYHIVGWSLGGHIGLEMLARYREVRSLLLTGTPPVRLDPAGISAGFRWTPSTALAGRRHFSDDDCRRYVRAMMGCPRASDQHLAAALRTDGNARKWMVQNGMAGVGVDEVDTVETDERPIAIVQGVQDPFVNLNYLSKLKYRNLWTKKPVLIDAGHAPHWQVPTMFNERMKEFLVHAG
ncbi:alpha/beta fold hydrolase [Bradyrhizobium sp. ERR14]|uniref:alpha/beta fold hydrolase n=1 Tax=Bradyrhizobium sp. ERR14 TaxID=2663837 RepID=UPI001606FEAB|nr:alpha/beta hydrolase [Bradyrhizobium sp. ERR14]MBB4398536.1 pimeloyl-ACP methyl ester carboxylesterase [Bradyrhizobium sp. ERR14]